MASEGPQRQEPIQIPADAISIKQSGWVWMLPALPWIALLAVSFFIDFISFGIIPLVLAAVIVGPRFIAWRRTLFILTEEHLVVQRGGFSGYQRVDLPFSDLREVVVRPGMLGGTLGYTTVYVTLRDGRVAILDHVPTSSPLIEHVRARVVPMPEDDEAADADSPAEPPQEDEGPEDPEGDEPRPKPFRWKRP